jgi:predicted DNA binding CopG/RHH family protein
MKNAKQKERKIHVALPDDVHQKLRVKCALKDVTIQEYVSRLIEKDVRDISVPRTGNRKEWGQQ